MAMKWIIAFLGGLLLAACSNDHENIQAWMAEQAAGMKGGVKPLPEIKPPPVASYEAGERMSPFDQGRLDLDKKASKGGGPDVSRRREPLEAFPLESLRMVGFLMKDKAAHAVVRADKALFQVRVGNYMGQNFGVITQISEGEVVLKELVEDLNGDWTERTSTLQLQEREAKK
jgi:type IV pilus assembly protein PilP